MNFVIFINWKCLKAISSVKTKKITKPFYRKNVTFFTLFLNICTGLGCFIRTSHIKWIHKVWVYLISERQIEIQGLLDKKANSMEWTYYGVNECIPKITITWIWLSYLTCVALFFNLRLSIGALLWQYNTISVFELSWSFTEKRLWWSIRWHSNIYDGAFCKNS